MRIYTFGSLLLFIPLAYACASSQKDGFDADPGPSDGSADDHDGSHGSQSAEGGAVGGDGEAQDGGNAIGDSGAGNLDSSVGTSDAALLADASGHDASKDAAPQDAAGSEGGTVFVPADPFTVDTSRPIATFAELVSHFGPGATTVSTGTFSITSRTRTSCNAVTGCTPWTSPATIVLVTNENDQFGNPVTYSHLLGTGGVPQIVLTLTPAPTTVSLALGTIEPQNTAALETFQCASIRSDDISPDFNCVVEVGPLHPSLGNGPIPLYFRRRDFQADSLPGPIPVWTGRINDDQTFQFVTNLVSPGGDVTAANNLDQIAIYGNL